MVWWVLVVGRGVDEGVRGGGFGGEGGRFGL
jgi:hypothetical protein